MLGFVKVLAVPLFPFVALRLLLSVSFPFRSFPIVVAVSFVGVSVIEGFIIWDAWHTINSFCSAHAAVFRMFWVLGIEFLFPLFASWLIASAVDQDWVNIHPFLMFLSPLGVVLGWGALAGLLMSMSCYLSRRGELA